MAVDCETGKKRWHFQIVHHGLWDYDLPPPPNRIDLMVDGKPRKVVAQASKQAFLFVLDGVTGEPLWPIEERPVPPSQVPGERASPTQPFPTKPAASCRGRGQAGDPAARSGWRHELDRHRGGPRKRHDLRAFLRHPEIRFAHRARPPDAPNSNLITYESGGRQYLAISVGGGREAAEDSVPGVVALALASDGDQ